MGSRGLHHGAPSARIASRARMPAPSIAPRWRANRRATPGPASAEADARIGESIGDVDEDVDEHVCRRHEEHAALHEREVLGEDPADDETAEAGTAEDRLHDHGAGEEIAELQAEDGDDRYQRVLERVPHHDAPPG